MVQVKHGDALHIDYEDIILQHSVALQPDTSRRDVPDPQQGNGNAVRCGSDSVGRTREGTAVRPDAFSQEAIINDTATLLRNFDAQSLNARDNGNLTDFHIIGNLPFNIATPLLVRYLKMMSDARSVFARAQPHLTLCFQREVGSRMLAPIRTKERCRLSVMCQLYADIRPGFIIPSRSFTPPPKVEGMVVTLAPRREQLDGLEHLSFDEVEWFVGRGFQQRRKRLRHNLMRLPGLTEAGKADAFLLAHGFKAETRAPGLGVKQWLKLALAYKMEVRGGDLIHLS